MFKSYRRPAAPALDGLAISYEHSEQSYQAEAPAAPVDGMTWPASQLRAVNITYDSVAYDRASCVDSLLDMYGSDIAEDAGEDDEHEEDQELEHEEIKSPAVSHHSPVERKEPWDQRGKNGLYGGGGRGADNTETGWVSEYEQEQENYAEEVRRRTQQAHEAYSRVDSVPTQIQSSSPAPAFEHDNYRSHQKRPSSGETDYSSYGPITPIDASFPVAATGYQTFVKPSLETSSPPRASNPILARQTAPPRSYSLSALASLPHHIQGLGHESILPLVSPVLEESTPPRRQSEPLTSIVQSQREDVIQVSPTKKIVTRIPSPTPPHGLVSTIVASSSIATPESTERVRKLSTGGFRWSRAKKAPIISNPILPEGFVESLGMETFALVPGCAPPHLKPKASKSTPSKAPPTISTKIPSPTFLTPKASPIYSSFAPLRSVSSLEKLKVRTSEISGPRELEDALPDYRKEMTEAFKRLSDDSDRSHYAASSLASIENSRQMYFDGLRARKDSVVEEVQANQTVASNSAHDLPRASVSGSRYRANAPAPLETPSTSKNSTNTGFRDPWEARRAPSSPRHPLTTHSKRPHFRYPALRTVSQPSPPTLMPPHSSHPPFLLSSRINPASLPQNLPSQNQILSLHSV